MNRTYRILLLSFIMALSVAAAANESDSSRIETIKSRLEKASGRADSITLMLNILDLTPDANKTPLATDIFYLAISEGNDNVASQMICWLAFVNRGNDSILRSLKGTAKLIKDPDRQYMASTYVSLRRTGYAARFAPSKERAELIQKSIEAGYFQNADNTYDRIETLGSLCILLGSSKIHRRLVTKYLTQELELLEILPENDIFVKNIMYNYACIIYSHLEMKKEAVDVAQKRLKLLDRMKEIAKREGRPFNPYKFVYYSTYVSILKNYETLSQSQIDEYYAATQRLSKENDESRKYHELGEAEAYYLMAKQRYSEAIPKLQHVLANSNDNYVNRRALTLLIKAADITGDKKALYEATSSYNQLLEKMLENDAIDVNAKMQALYHVDDLQKRNAQLSLSHFESKAKAQHTLSLIFICAAIILTAVIIVISRQYRRARKLANGLAKANDALRQESETLLKTKANLIAARDKATKAERHKTEFINNMSHELTTPVEAIVEYSQLIVDCIHDEKKKYLQRYGDIVRLNATLLQSIINDILYIGMLENSVMTIKKAPASVHEICHMAIESVANRYRPEVELIYSNENAPDTLVITDSKRVVQVLTNLLTNAEKFTEKGSIHLEYRIDAENYTLNFSVTDTGCGIPDGKEEEIFNRFVKLDKQAQGVGLGLPISRMIAQLLHGSVYVDTSYTKGARFIFSIPIA